MLEEPTSLRIDDPGVRTLFSEAARFQSWLDVEAALGAGQRALCLNPPAAHPGVRTLFSEAARFQSGLDVEAALAEAQAELGIIPAAAAREIVSKAHLKYLDLAAVRAGLAESGHPLVPLGWALDQAWGGG